VLRYATAALAAKHLSRVGGFTAIDGGPCTRLALTETYPYSTQVDWSYKAADYYYKAITNLPEGPPQHPISTSESLFPNDHRPAAALSPVGVSDSCCKTDPLLASNAILMVYDILDSNAGAFCL
jgi:hypothetical protein